MKITILISKIIIFITSKFGRGSALPGKIALKLDKNILKKFKLPKNIIAVTGSSGKGTTSKLIACTLRSQNKIVLHNHLGGNLITGITTMLLNGCNLKGEINYDYIVYEIDERYFKTVVDYVKPKVVVITNITRDQPPRQGHFDYVYEDIKKCISNDMHLILNSDDPFTRKFTLDKKCSVTYFGINENNYSYKENMFENLVIQYCPNCNTKLNYNYYNFEIYGDYYCPKCDFKRIEPEYAITKIDYENEKMIVNNKYEITILNNILYNIYNIASCIATVSYLGFNLDDFIPYISKSEYDHKLCNHYTYNNKDVIIYYNKNENSTSFNQTLMNIAKTNDKKTIVIGWENISLRYKHKDVSWIYDVYFELLKTCNTENVICVGPSCYDIATRLKIAGFDKNQITTYEDFDESVELLLNSNNNTYFVVNPDYIIPLLKIMKGNEE